MSVSLVVLRVEIASDHLLLPHIHYTAPKVQRAMSALGQSDNVKGMAKKTSAPKALDGDATVPGKEEDLQKNHRGCRDFHEISIETLTEVDTGALDTSASSSKSLGRGSSGLSKGESADSAKQARKAKGNRSMTEPKPSSSSVTSCTEVKPTTPLLGEKEVLPVLSEESRVSRDGDAPPVGSMELSNQKESSPATSESSGSSLDRRMRGLLPTQMPFLSGNHFVEVTHGILHLYKENQRTTMGEEAERSEMLCILAVPAAMTTHDLLQFTAPVSQEIEHMRIIRDSKPNQFMVLLKFRTQKTADEFYRNFNGVRFNSIEPEMCHLVYVAKVETVKESDNACLPLAGHTELPTCPVCLERMDESVEGILTILCNHSFHGSCLSKWGDTSCPVCRYCQTPELVPDNHCFKCSSSGSTQESLWICLICGHVGCGRYVEGHAFKHYIETQHTYAMQLGNNRVWDYAGDNYVHRLVQNKADGKPVELQNDRIDQDEKLDSIQLEYTYLLTSQLETQRRFFENCILRLEKDTHRQLEELEEKTHAAINERKQLEDKLARIVKDRQAHEKKATQLTTKLNKATTELKEEKEMNKCLRQNQQVWQQKLKDAEKQLKDLKESQDKELHDLQEQVRDLMFFLEAQEKLQNVPEATKQEIQEGQIVVGAAAAPSPVTAPSRHRRKKMSTNGKSTS